jgi:hypothetical protein
MYLTLDKYGNTMGSALVLYRVKGAYGSDRMEDFLMLVVQP